MSRKLSSVYQHSSFDAVESTRRLSEQLSNNESSFSQDSTFHGSSKKLDSAGRKHDLIENQPGHVLETVTDQIKKSNDHDSNNNNNADNCQRRGNKDFNGENALLSTSKRRNANKDEFDQRSESDSDLDSVDDFSNGALSDDTNNEANQNDVTSNRRESHESQNSKHNTALSNENARQSATNNDFGLLKQTDFTSAEEISIVNGTANPIAKAPEDKTKGLGTIETSQMRNDTDQHIGPMKTTEFAQLTKEEIDNKLRDDDVIRQGEMLETVREIGVSNLNRIQNLNWNDPALRRLFMKPRIKALEVKAVKVDPDIKNIVNEFLKTNVTENFVISRVLRENYAVFYSWLAAYVQTERNAWTTRLAQALNQADQERKTSLQCRNSLVEAAARLRMLVKTSSNLLFGIPDKDDEMFFKIDAFRRHDKKDNGIQKELGKRGKGHVLSTDGGYTSDGNAGLLRKSGKCPYNKISQGKKGDLVPSNYRLVKISDSTQGKVNYDSDPGETITDRCLMDENIAIGMPHNEKLKNKHMERKSSDASPETRNTGVSVLYSGYDLEGYIIDDDKSTDWNQVLLDNIEVLTDICDTLLIDRKACLQIVKTNPMRCESLVDAVSSFVKNRRVEMNDKRDIEKRLRTLETENRTLQDEMSILQRTLADKNRDALSLQSQLDRLENMIASYAAPKLNKCVGTNEEMFPAVFKNNLTVGGNKTPRQNNHNLLNMSKATKSPRSMEKESKPKTLELPSVNGMSNIKYPRQKREFHSPNLSGTAKDDQRGSSLDVPDDTPHNTSDLSSSQRKSLIREPSLIEISEEKLKTLKHRAKTLEDSLHDAITSMEKLSKSTKQCTGSSGPPYPASSLGSLYNRSKVNSDTNGPRTFRKWQKASFEVNSISYDVNTTPRVAIIKRSNSFSKQYDDIDKEQVAPDVRVTLPSETSSLLEGRCIPNATRDMANQTPPVSSLRTTSEKRQGLTLHSSRSNVDEYTSDDERSRCDNDGVHTYRRHTDHQSSDVSSKNYGSQARRQRARHNTSRHIAGRQTVSKCLRCQKLFSPIDNHKLACCYHTKDKERLEHYDQSGMLIRVIYAWKCCHEPQESEGCCYGQHV